MLEVRQQAEPRLDERVEGRLHTPSPASLSVGGSRPRSISPEGRQRAYDFRGPLQPAAQPCSARRNHGVADEYPSPPIATVKDGRRVGPPRGEPLEPLGVFD